MKTQPGSVVGSERRLTVAPACDVYENDDEILVVADLPGFTSEALTVNLEDNELTIEAQRDVSRDEAFITREYRDCDFQRRFAVPGGIDAAKISAELNHGVLSVHLPKSEALKPRQIAVRAG